MSASRDAALPASQSPESPLELGKEGHDYFMMRQQASATVEKKREKKRKEKREREAKAAKADDEAMKKRKSESKVSSKSKKARDEGGKNEDNDRMKWTDDLKRIFVDCLAEATGAQRKNSDGSGFKPAEWKQIRLDFNRKANLDVNNQQLQSQYNSLKTEYHAVNFLLSQSGIGWDNDTKRVYFDAKAWEALLVAHPKKGLKKYESNCFYYSMHETMCEIMEGRTATGKFAKSTDDSDTDSVDDAAADGDDDDDDDGDDDDGGDDGGDNGGDDGEEEDDDDEDESNARDRSVLSSSSHSSSGSRPSGHKGVAGKPGTPLKSLKSPKKGKKGKSSESPVPIVPKLKPAPKPPKLTPAQERAALDKTNSAALTAMAASFGTRKLSTTETAMNLFTKNHGQEYVNRPGDRLKVKMHLKKPEEAEMFLTLEKDEADLYIAGILDM